MKKLGLGFALLMACAASSTFAATGVITFNGELVGGTCSATVNGGAASETVTLPTIQTSALTTAGDVAGITPFTINLTGAGCSTGGTATPYFEYEMGKVNTAGRLVNTGAATNVDVQLLSDDQTVIDASVPAATQETSTGVNVAADSNDFNYFARYYATGAAGAGAVAASVSYNIIYK